MYSRLYDSMLAWYGQWYSGDTSRGFSAALGMTVFMALNVLSVVNFFGIVGSYTAIELYVTNKAVFFPLFAALATFHLAFAVWRSTSVKERGQNPATSTSKRAAGCYMAISGAAFFLSYFLLIALHRRT
jgi:hypothetical protein